MLIPPMMRTENEWSYEPLRQVMLVPPMQGRHQGQGRQRRPQPSFSVEDTLELSLDSQILGAEEELARVWDLFSCN